MLEFLGRLAAMRRSTPARGADSCFGGGGVFFRAAFLGVLLGLAGAVPSGAAEAARVDFSREVLPILSENCFYCHGPDSAHRKGKLRLDDETDAKRSRDDGSAIVPGESGKSAAMTRILSKDPDEQMPPPNSHKELTRAQIETLRRWIDGGARWGQIWSFTELTRPAIPSTVISGFAQANEIDAFVADRLAREKMKPSPEADKRTLIRRVSLDLTGLPPTPEAVEAFLVDSSTNAYEKVVDRLLASPAYGERMAWDWMEAARYADSNGYQGDGERTMWPWRDWVVKVFNQNLSYDRFTIWQLAGDLLPGATEEQKLATAFCRNHAINGEGGRIAEENRVDYVMDMTETTATVWLGLTFNCTRCHDHKFDPLTRRDYFGMFAFFNQTPVDGGGGNPQTRPVLELPSAAQAVARSGLEREAQVLAEKVASAEWVMFPRPAGRKASESVSATNLTAEVRGFLDQAPRDRDNGRIDALAKALGAEAPGYAADLRELKAKRDALNEVARSIPRPMIMQDMESPRKTFVLERGLYNRQGAEVSASTPAKLPAMSSEGPMNRLGLARWLVSPENPLTPRVTVNRVWQMFFGMGLVKTAEDFGSKGEFPKNLELLDWLGCELRDSGWDVKHLVRLIVTSQTYKQSSRVTREALECDPENRLLGRGARFRMPSWMLRDQALAASGLLVPKVGGPPVKPYQPAGVWEETTFGEKRYQQDHGEALYRRSLYIFWRRIVGPTVLFDTASRMTCVVKPTRNNSPLHALTTLNDVTYVEAARALAARVMSASPETGERVSMAFRLVLAREPSERERLLMTTCRDRARERFTREPGGAEQLLEDGELKQSRALDPVEQAAWTASCLALLNLDETLTKE